MNLGANAAFFWGYSPDSPQTWREHLIDQAWEEVAWDWCGAGLELQILEPGESITFTTAAYPGQTVRIGARFSADRNGEF